MKADIGYILCGSLLDYQTGKVITRINVPGILKRNNNDRKAVAQIRDDWEKYDIWVTWNGKMFDVPYLITRLAKWKERPLVKQKHIDLMYYARRPFLNLHSSRLDAVAKFLKSPNQKTPLDLDTWSDAASGDRKALALVVEHCEADVRVLGDVYEHLKGAVATIHR